MYQDRKKRWNISELFPLNRKRSFLEESRKFVRLKLVKLRRPRKLEIYRSIGSLPEIICIVFNDYVEETFLKR